MFINMPLFRRKTAPPLPRTSSISVYGQGRAQALQKSKYADKLSASTSNLSIDLDDRPHPLAFAEATFDPALPIKTKSRLSKDILEILRDNAALAYFIQYMDARKAKHLVKFWLETESFRISSETKQKILETTPLTDSNLTTSSSYAMDKCDDVFQSSSQTQNSDSQSGSTLNDYDNFNAVPPVNSAKTCVLDGVCDTLLVGRGDKMIVQSSSVDSGCEVRSKDSIPSVEALAECVENEVESETGVQIDRVPGKARKSEKIKREDALDDGDQGAYVLRDGLVRLETSTLQDAIAIYSKYVAEDASFPVGITNELKFAIQNEIFKPSADIDSQCFVPAQEFIVKRMDKEYYPNFLRSSFHCKHQIDVLTSGNVFLADVLYNDSALFFFMEFMEQECVRHLVDFLLMADNFYKHLLSQQLNYDGMQAQTDAMVLYDKYFSLQATTPLGFSDSVRFELEANICQEKGPMPDCFSKPVRILTQYLEKTYLLQFLSSQLYFKYISECIIIIQSDGVDSSSQSKPPGSDSGSEQSLPISSINTLLAMDSKHPGSSKSSRTMDTQDAKMDLLQFKPDDLWQRPLASKLQMAHVDHLGRVTTGFEPPDPEKRKESKISKAVKKLVNWEEDKNQEEMAWKVAEMIVKDICSVTMPESEYPFKAENSLNLES